MLKSYIKWGVRVWAHDGLRWHNLKWSKRKLFMCTMYSVVFFRFRAWITFGWDCEHFETKVFNRKPHKPIDIPGWLWALQTIMFTQYQIVWHLTAKCNHIYGLPSSADELHRFNAKWRMKKKQKQPISQWQIDLEPKKTKREPYQRRQKNKTKKTTKNCRGKTL